MCEKYYIYSNVFAPCLRFFVAVWSSIEAKLKKKNRYVIYSDRYTVLTMFHFTRVCCTTPMRWHFEIYFSQRKTFPSFSVSQCCALRLTACFLGSRGGFERKFTLATLLPSLHLQQVRWPGVWERDVAMGGRDFTVQRKWQCQLNITFNFLVLWSPGY